MVVICNEHWRRVDATHSLPEFEENVEFSTLPASRIAGGLRLFVAHLCGLPVSDAAGFVDVQMAFAMVDYWPR
jgi:hypothetical protein